MSASNGNSACHSDVVTESHVLKAMRVPSAFILGTIRLSVGIHTESDDMGTAAKFIVDSLKCELANKSRL